MVKLLAIIALLGACYEDRYRCESDADCDRGPGTRCELDGFCSSFDGNCVTQRAYDEHSAELAGTCVAGQVAIANVCAGGQPAAVREGCAATVCEALPSCCDVGWSDACVQQAQLRCDVQCDLRIALTGTSVDAQDRSFPEHWELVWDGTTWTATERTDREGVIAWLAPAPGTIEPRPAGFNLGKTELLVGGVPLQVNPDLTYVSLTSVDYDRSGRDTIAIGIVGPQITQLVDVASGAVRDLSAPPRRLVWGASNKDGFPDAVAHNNASYTLLRNEADERHVRVVDATQTNAVGGQQTPGRGGNGGQIRSLDWMDVDGDEQLDLAVFGNQIRINFAAAAGGISDSETLVLDCDPIITGCANTPTSLTLWVGAVSPRIDGAELVVAMFPPSREPPLDRKMFRIALDGRRFLEAPQIEDTCVECGKVFHAVFARDLDGDHVLDVIAIDENLRVHTALSSGDGKLRVDPLVAGIARTLTIATTTVSGQALSP